MSPPASRPHAGSPHSLVVLLLSENDASGNLDKRALRDAGVSRVETLTSGVRAARLLAGCSDEGASFMPDVVVCTQRLEDMTGEQFCAILRLHPLLLDLPVLLILPHDNEVEQLKTLGCGASALLARPYSVQSLKNHLESLAASHASLAALERAGQFADTKAFDDALATYGMLLKPVRDPEDYFRVGMQCLHQGKWNYALNAFQRALRGALIQGKAELGMAAAWKGKGDTARYRQCLARAAATFVRASQWNRARAVYGRLLQAEPDARSPFLAESLHRMRLGDYTEAAAILAQGYSVTPRQQLRDRLAEACLVATEPQAALQSMERMLEHALGTDVGEVLGAEIRATLDTLARQLEVRRQEEAAERQRQARLAARRKEAAATSSAKTATSENASSPGAGDADRSAIATKEDSTWNDVGDARKVGAGGLDDSLAIAPLNLDVPGVSSPGVTDETIPEGSGGHGASKRAWHGRSLGDILSVMRFTWRLSRKKN